jgi:hypothetical protein
MRTLRLIAVALLVLFFVPVPAVSYPDQGRARTDREQAEAARRAAEAGTAASHIGPSCLPAPLPAVPIPPVYTLNTAWFDDAFRLDIWRQPCADGTPDYPLLMRITPLGSVPFVCSASFTILQAFQQFDVKLRRRLPSIDGLRHLLVI